MSSRASSCFCTCWISCGEIPSFPIQIVGSITLDLAFNRLKLFFLKVVPSQLDIASYFHTPGK